MSLEDWRTEESPLEPFDWRPDLGGGGGGERGDKQAKSKNRAVSTAAAERAASGRPAANCRQLVGSGGGDLLPRSRREV